MVAEISLRDTSTWHPDDRKEHAIRSVLLKHFQNAQEMTNFIFRWSAHENIHLGFAYWFRNISAHCLGNCTAITRTRMRNKGLVGEMILVTHFKLQESISGCKGHLMELCLIMLNRNKHLVRRRCLWMQDAGQL